VNEARCTRCCRWLPLKDFARNANHHMGRDSWCRSCHVEATREWRARNPEYVEAYKVSRRLGPRPFECVECGQTFTRRSSKAIRCPDCRRARKLEQRRALRS
jgi:hypothetical protein